MRGLAIVIGLSSCGRIGFDAPIDANPRDVSDARDASNAHDASGDGAEAACQTDARYVVVAGLTSLYRTVGTNLSWDAARSDCAADGAYLTIPDGPNEAGNVAVGDWIGLTDAAQEGVWRTVQGVPATYMPWQAGEPGGGSGENCARLDDASGQLEDRECTDTRDYSCECE